MTALTKPDVVRARIESKVKRDAGNILKRLGVSHSTFINMSYRAVVETGGIPFSLHVPNAETARVLRGSKKSAKRVSYTKASSLDEFHAKLKATGKR